MYTSKQFFHITFVKNKEWQDYRWTRRLSLIRSMGPHTKNRTVTESEQEVEVHRIPSKIRKNNSNRNPETLRLIFVRISTRVHRVEEKTRIV